MNNKMYKINLKVNEPIIDVLREVCWGFKINNFEEKIGEKPELVELLLERLLNERDSKSIEVDLSNHEVEIIRKAFVEVKKEIEEEFETRFGLHLNEVEELPIFQDNCPNTDCGILEWFQSWYQLQCNGNWEELFGINIKTLDSQWHLSIDLNDTKYIEIIFQDVEKRFSEDDWFFCKVRKGKFEGSGSSNNLIKILNIFRNWIDKANKGNIS